MKNDHLYKITISVFFGVLGFYINFQTIIFPVGMYTIAVLFGLLFPLFITLSWGWKYGLLSALSGGCQSMWWLWGPSNGYAIFPVVLPFTFWILWHGFFAEVRRKQEKPSWWLNIYVIEIPFRILATINLFTLSRWAVSLNPPPWAWASDAPNIIPMHFSVFVAIKQASVAYTLLLISNVLLNIPYLRRLFKLKQHVDHRKTGYIVSVFLLLGVFFWILDSFVHTVAFDDNYSFIDLLVRDIPDHHIFTRLIFFIFCMISGLFASNILRRQKEGELALEESEARLRTLIKSIPDLVWLKDTNGVYLACNARFELFFGAMEKEIIGKTDYNFVGKEVADLFRLHDKSPIDKGCSVKNEETVTYASDGHSEILETIKTPMFTKKGDIFGVLGIGRDITDRKRREEEIKLFRTIADKAVHGCAIADIKGSLIYVNDYFARIHGYGPQELIGRNISLFHNEEQLEEVAEINKSLTEKGSYPPQEIWHIHKNGTAFLMLMSGVTINDNSGTPEYIAATAIDITDRKTTEDLLRQAQKMESIGTLAGGIAHDFNNILAAILGYAEMAKDDCQPGSTISKDLDEVLEAAHRAKGLVRQILAFSRQDATERIHLQPASIVKEVITMLRPSLPTTIEITQDIDAVTGLISVDPTQLNQILMNLCTNAFHAMEETGGKLDISLKEVTLKGEDLVHEPDVADGTFIQLSISDSGPGITSIVKDKMFDPYFTTKEVGKGTGMGLATVHGIVKSYGGFITLCSELGEGTVFHVFLPVEKNGKLPENEILNHISIGKERILFVDDEEILATMGQTMLERLGYQVTVRNSSLEALETFQNQPYQFDLIITDQTMPGMTGSDMSRRMLQIRPDIPIILCTGYSSIISEGEAKSMGIKEFAFKPLAKKDIAQLIRKVLDVS